MTMKSTGLEWSYELEQLTWRFDGLFGVGDESVDQLVEQLFISDEEQTRSEIKKRLRVDDDLLTGATKAEKDLEREWMEQRRHQAREAVRSTLAQVDALIVDERTKALLVNAIAELVDLGIKAGPYQPWMERLQALKKAEDVRHAERGRAGNATDALVEKTEKRSGIVRGHLTRAKRTASGRLIDPERLLVKINHDLAKAHLGKLKTTRSLSRYRKKIEERQT